MTHPYLVTLRSLANKLCSKHHPCGPCLSLSQARRQPHRRQFAASRPHPACTTDLRPPRRDTRTAMPPHTRRAHRKRLTHPLHFDISGVVSGPDLPKGASYWLGTASPGGHGPAFEPEQGSEGARIRGSGTVVGWSVVLMRPAHSLACDSTGLGSCADHQGAPGPARWQGPDSDAAQGAGPVHTHPVRVVWRLPEASPCMRGTRVALIYAWD